MLDSITIRIPSDLKKVIIDEARALGTTQSDFLRQIIESSIGQVSSSNDRTMAEAELSLSPFERGMLRLQVQTILAVNGKLPAEFYDEERLKMAAQVLDKGFSGEYSSILPEAEAELSVADCELVWDILDMFRVLESSVESLGDTGWQGLGLADAEYYGKFRGFDGNNNLESKLGSYVRFLIASGRWEEQRGFVEKTDGNSHCEMLPTYRRMLATFKPIWREVSVRGSRGHLDVDEIRTTLMAGGARSDTALKDE